MTSTNGQKVINPTSKKLSIGENRLVLEKMDLKPGIYIISISNIDGISSKKLIVQ
ncbi:MAG: T9SS type A sorting domain-containing protein [Saprospiraceae bacterium]|nr:T9SS type A sorting domain-containing protein [Candidatus Brachybacter algidus]